MDQNKNTTILIVDDDDNISELLYQFLLELGIKSHISKDGREAIKYLSEHEVNIVITDFNMPVLNGLDLIRYIRKNDHLSEVKVILMTGGVDSELSKALALADEHIYKPFDFNHLTALIKSLYKV
jgi:DNA-binding response OmpR family regulator